MARKGVTFGTPNETATFLVYFDFVMRMSISRASSNAGWYMYLIQTQLEVRSGFGPNAMDPPPCTLDPIGVDYFSRGEHVSETLADGRREVQHARLEVT